ncbi:Holliday junction resolvase RuvX [soil metagenome]
MGRLLALDYGSKRVGAAISDPTRTIATPLEVYQRRSKRVDAEHYRALVQEHEVDRIVIGLPIRSQGEEGESARQARAWGAWLADGTGLPVTFFDERFTTVEAENLLRSHGLNPNERKARRDMLAAQILLSAYLDAGCPDSEAPPAPLNDPPPDLDRENDS